LVFVVGKTETTGVLQTEEIRGMQRLPLVVESRMSKTANAYKLC